ncbi:MAG TPA: AAA family ATPase [Pseudonocardia sp.]
MQARRVAGRPGLVGRHHECSALDRLVAGVRGGHSEVLVLRGEAGVGKSALLDHVIGNAPGCQVARAAGIESEMELAFAGLHQLCAPFLNRLEAVPGPQCEALGTALGLRSGDTPDRFLIGLAVLSLLSDAAREQPLICIIDDAQWLDRASAQTLAFVARRLAAEAVALVFAVRDPFDEHDWAGLPTLVVAGLPDRDARTLLDALVTGPLDERVRERILTETRGNPLALLSATRELSPEQMAGGFGMPGTGPLPDRIEAGFRRRLVALPPATQRLLLVAAAEPDQDPVLVWRAAGLLGVGVDAAEPAIADGLVEFAGQVRFCHPLARSAVYRAASAEERRRIHGALADATDPGRDAERRAWHRAHATSGLDETVAADLERSAGRARARGGLAAAAAFRERAAELTPDPQRRAQRALAAAQAKHQAGAPDRALRLLAIADAGPQDELARARCQLLRAQIATGAGAGRDAPLLAAAKRLEQLDAALARETYRDAFYAALNAGRLATRGSVREVAQAVRALPPPSGPGHAGDLLLDGLARVITDGYAAGAPLLRSALDRFRNAEVSTEEAFRWLPLAAKSSHDVWDDESWHTLAHRLVTLARDSGALTVLPVALMLGLADQLFAGAVSTAAAMAEEADAVGRATGHPLPPYGALVVAAWRGREAEVTALAVAATAEMTARDEGQWLTAGAWASALLYNGMGRYDDACIAAERGSAYPDELGLASWSMVELVEAAARSGTPERAAGAMRRLTEIAEGCDTDWARGVEARSRALLREGEPAERAHREAIARLGRTRVRSGLARAHLNYGEWLRRENRRMDARVQLRLAHDMLTEMGAEAFAERARRELLATGETVRKRRVDRATDLTEQEAQIARLAVAGHTNPEIGTRLFLSPRTVEWHLRKVFSKLGISSRKELRSALRGDVSVQLPA